MSTDPTPVQRELFPDLVMGSGPADPDGLHESVAKFDEFGTRTFVTRIFAGGRSVPTYVNEFWTRKHRAANSLQEISYRACFKPQLPGFFIDRLTKVGDLVYDPFLGRGTTMVEAALRGRVPAGCDINPLSRILVLPRLVPPTMAEIAARLESIDLRFSGTVPDELLVFFHTETLGQICALQEYLRASPDGAGLDHVDRWIQMVAVNRLTGHSPGFFSVYTMPPNQAVSIDSQKKINARRNQEPQPRDVKKLILKKSKSLLSNVDAAARKKLASVADDPRLQLVTTLAADTPQIETNSVRLVVTSPPFLDVVQYKIDNWLRCWFCDIDPAGVAITMHRKLDVWQAAMAEVFRELARVVQPGGYVAFEVGEVRGGSVRLEEAVVPCGIRAGLEPVLLLINDQTFTKTANCWGVDNNRKGTNTNRVVVFRHP